MALESLGLPARLRCSTNSFTELHHGDVGPVLPSGEAILNRDTVA